MANHSLPLLQLLKTSGTTENLDFLREGVKLLAQSLMEWEASQKTGAGFYQRSKERQSHRNGYRERDWNTRVGTIPLQIPKLRKGSYFPSILEPRRRAEKALLSVVQEAYVHGVSTRKVENLVQGLGLTGMDKSQVSRICKELDDEVQSFRTRPLLFQYPYVWLDALFPKIRENGRVVSMAMVVATGVRETGEREVLGLDLGPAEDGPFWESFLKGLVSRGLHGVQLVISDSHQGLKQAIAKVLNGASWQRCRVHFTRNALSYVPKGMQPTITAAIRTIFAQPNQEEARFRLRQVSDELAPRFSKVSALLEEAEDDILAHMVFPREHWRQIYSTNPLERLNKEIRRRINVVGIFPNQASAIRLVGALLAEQNDEWFAGRRYFSQESMKKLQNLCSELEPGVLGGGLSEPLTGGLN